MKIFLMYYLALQIFRPEVPYQSYYYKIFKAASL